MSDDQEGGAKAQNTADGEQSSDPVLVLQAEGQVLEWGIEECDKSLIFYQDYIWVQKHKLCNHTMPSSTSAYLAGNTAVAAEAHHRLREVTCNNTAAAQHFVNFLVFF